MWDKLNYFAPLLAAGAIAVAPIAAATPSQDAPGGGGAASSGSTPVQQSCVNLGGTQSQCQSPGQVYDAPPQVDYFPYAGGGT
jgi:hypothetical protein